LVGQPLKLRPWQKKIIRAIYDTPTRRAVISFGRKNGKTALAAVLTLLHLVGPEARPNSQLFSAAQSREQAAILFSLAAKIVRMSPELREYVGIRDTAKQLFVAELGTLYRALSAEASTAYGFSPVFVVHDELGQVVGPRSELYEALETAAGAQEQPLSIVISTQAPTSADLLSVLIDDAKTGIDKKVKLFLYTAPEELDPFSDEALKAANPAYGDFLNPDEVRDQAEGARRMPARESAYRNLVLNQRVNMNSPLFSRSVWIACAAPPDEEAFRSGEVYGGLDLSARNDLTALVLVARGGDGKWHVKPEFWAPETGLVARSQRDRAPYDVWAKQGDLNTTPGASIDLSFVARRLGELREEMDIRAIAYDRWRMDYLTKELSNIGVEFTVQQKIGEQAEGGGLVLVKHGQGFQDMPPAIDGLEAELLNLRVRHGGHPILNWCAANAVAERNAAGERKLEKSKSTGRIDGVVALAMAMRIALTYSGGPGEYVSGPLIAL
jgi:phage terminase large subunit-like protein